VWCHTSSLAAKNAGLCRVPTTGCPSLFSSLIFSVDLLPPLTFPAPNLCLTLYLFPRHNTKMDAKFEPISPSSSEGLLKSECDPEEDSFDDISLYRNRSGKRWTRFVLPSLIHLTLIALYTAVCIYLLDRNNKRWNHGPNLIYCTPHFPSGYGRCY
jgi:hypothetical protein